MHIIIFKKDVDYEVSNLLYDRNLKLVLISIGITKLVYHKGESIDFKDYEFDAYKVVPEDEDN